MRPIKHWIAPPTFERDEDKTRRARLLNTILIITLAYLGLVEIGNLAGGRTPFALISGNLVLLALCLLARHWMYRGRVEQASAAFVALLIVYLTAVIAGLGTIRVPATALYASLVLIAGLLLDARGLVATTVLSALAILGLIIAENAGLLPRPDLTVTVTQWMTSAAQLGTLAGLVYYVQESSRGDMRRANAELAERRSVEEALRISEQSARRAAEQMRIINQASMAITAGMGFERLMWTLYEQCRPIGDTDTFFVALYDDATGMIDFPFYCKDGERRALPSRSIRETSGLSGYVINHGHTLYVPDSFDWPSGLPGPVRTSGIPTRSFIGVPLMVEERVAGVLSMQSHAPNAYTSEQIRLVELLGTQIAIAIQNNRLYDQVRASETHLKEAQRLAHIGSSTWDARTDTTTWSDELYRIVGWNPGVPAPSRMEQAGLFTAGSWAQLDDAMRRALATGEPYALELEIVRPDGTRCLTETRGTAVRDQRGNVVALHGTLQDITERKRAEDLVRIRNQMLLAIHQVTLEIGAELRLALLLPTILEQAQSMLNADRGGGIYLTESGEDGLRLAYGSGINVHREGIMLHQREGVVGRVYQTSRPFVIDDYTHWEGHATILVADPPSTVMGVPLFVRGKVTGVLTLIADSHLRKFTEEDVQQAEMFAAQAAVAIQNAQLYQRAREDLADRQRAEQALRASEARLNEAQRLAHIGSSTWDARTDTSIWSDEVYRIVGWDPAVPAPSRSEQAKLYTAESWAQLDDAIRRALATGEPYALELEIVRPDGTRRLTEARGTAVHDERGTVVALHGTLQDITERHRAEQALHESEERYRRIVETAREGIFVFDADWRLSFANARFPEILGYAHAELIGRSIRDLILEDDRSSHEARKARQVAGVGGVYENAYRTKSGAPVWLQISISPMIEHGKFVGTFGMATDITERKRHEHELESIAELNVALRTAESRTAMISVILDKSLEMLHVQGAILALCNLATGKLSTELGRGEWASFTGRPLSPETSVSGRVVATGQPYVSDAIKDDPLLARPDLIGDLNCIACVPLMIANQTIGALGVGRRTPLGKDQVRLLTSIADIAANAIHRMSLHEKTEQRLTQVQALHTIDTAISSYLDLRAILDFCLEQITTLLQVDAGDVLTSDPTGALKYMAGRGFRSRQWEHTHLRLGEGHAGRAAMERSLVRIPNLCESQGSLARAPWIAKEQFVAYFGVPLIAKGRVNGVLELFHRAALDPDPDWLELVAILAGQVAIAIDNLSLFDNLQRSNSELALAYDTTLEGWSRALDLRDKETEGHTQRVAELTCRLAQRMGIGDEHLAHFRRGALLHDIGKMAIPDSILLKPGPLSEEEWRIMRQHPSHAYALLLPVDYLRPALDIPYCHHEKWDGSGYPQGLKGNDIPQSARLFSVIDVWDALTSDRPYRKAWPQDRAKEYLREQAGRSFDPRIVEIFMQLIESGG